MQTEEEQETLPSNLQVEGEEAQRKLVILGIPWETTSESMRAYFSRFCPVQDAVVMRDRYSGKSRGFGFVTFYSADNAQRIATAEHNIDGRRCDAKFALPRGNNVSTTSPPKVPRIFVARVPQTISDVQFKTYWEDFGPVEDAYMPKDVSKAGHRGIGFVTFQGSDALERVMATTHSMHGTELAVDRAEPKAAERLPASLAWLGRTGQNMSPSLASAMLLNGLPDSMARSGGANSLSNLQHLAGLQTLRRDPDLPATLDDSSNGQASAVPQAEHLDHHSLSNSLAGSSAAAGTGLQMGEVERAALESLALANAGHQLGPLEAQRLQLILQSQQEQQQRQQQAYARANGANTRTVQALQGLTFGNSSSGIGIGLGMLQSAQNGSGSLPMSNGRGLDASDPSWQMMQAARSSGGMEALLAGAGDRGRAAAPQAHVPAGAAYSSSTGARASGPRIFIGKLNKETTESDVKDHFSRFGYVMDVYMPRDKMNRSDHRGFGFVTFETQGALARIMAHDQPHAIRGSVIAIDDAAPRKEDGASAGGSVFPRGSSIPAHDSPQNYNTSSLPMDGIEGLSMGAANGDESMGPARRHPDDRLRNGYKPY